MLDGERQPASDMVVSLFEPHTDIIRKGGRAAHYGHKINLSTERSALVLGVVVEKGNPADSERCLPILRRRVDNYGATPQPAAFDGGYVRRGPTWQTPRSGRRARGVPQEPRSSAGRHDVAAPPSTPISQTNTTITDRNYLG